MYKTPYYFLILTACFTLSAQGETLDNHIDRYVLPLVSTNNFSCEILLVLKSKTNLICLIISIALLPICILAQVNYKEENIIAYELPKILISNDGRSITTIEDWKNIRRPEIFGLFEKYMYGAVVNHDLTIEFESKQTNAKALDGKATQRQVTITIENENHPLPIEILIYVPNNVVKPVPLFVGMNFLGNQSIHPDKSIPTTKNYVINNGELGITDHKANEQSRGARAHRWPVERIIERGYGLATLHCGDLDPDFDDGFKNGIHALIDYSDKNDPNERSTISAWAYGLSKAMDYFEADNDIDQNRITVIGHSRLGKAALWVGAVDQRFAMVISNNSGCGGAALSRRKFGETVERINTNFPHWFSKNFHRFNDQEAKLPIDQHMLLALMAPRPVYVASAVQDQWADPRGEFLSLFHAGPVYELFGLPILDDDAMPEVNKPMKTGRLGYHIRSGKHDVTTYDWEQYLDFADEHLRP